MVVRSKENTEFIIGVDRKACIKVSTKQKWEVKDSKVPNMIMLTRDNIKLIFSTEDFKRYFEECHV